MKGLLSSKKISEIKNLSLPMLKHSKKSIFESMGLFLNFAYKGKTGGKHA